MSEQLNPQAATAAVDSGLGAVVMLLRYHGIGADLGQIRPSDCADSGQLISEPKTLIGAPLTVHPCIRHGRGLRISPGKRTNSSTRLAGCP
jgi:hypothetical protein